MSLMVDITADQPPLPGRLAVQNLAAEEMASLAEELVAYHRKGAHVVWSTQQPRLHDVLIEQVVGPTSDNDTQISREDIEKRSGVAIQAIQPHEDGSWGEPKLCRIAGHDPNCSSHLPTVIPVARAAKRAE